MFLRLAELAGWEGACAYVAQAPVEEAEEEERTLTRRERAIAVGAIDDPVALPVTDLLPMHGVRRPCGPRAACRGCACGGVAQSKAWRSFV